MPCHLDNEPDFVVDFHLPSPVASSQPLRLPDGRWELGTSIQMAMVKSSAANGDPFVRPGHLCLVQGLAFGSRGLGVVPHPYYARQFGTSDHPYHGLFDNEPGCLFLVGD